MKELFKDKEKSKKRPKIMIYFIIGILSTILMKFYIGDLFESNSWVYCGAIGFGIVIILYILKRVGIIKGKSEEKLKEEEEEKELEKERVKKEKEQIDSLEFRELIKQISKEESKLDYMKDSLKKNKEYHNTNWIWHWVYFGFIVFFVAFLFFGSLDGIYFDRTIYVEKIEGVFDLCVEKLIEVMELLRDSIENLIIKFYDIGARNPKIFFALWVVTIIWWIGYMFIYKMFEQSYVTIKEFIVPIIKNIYKKLKGGQKKDGHGRHIK